MRFTKQFADDLIARHNTLKGLDGIEAGSLYRYSASGRQRLCRVSKGHGQIDVGYGIMTSKDIAIVVDSLIDQHYWDTNV
jgi:hypothetical protein